MVVSTERSQKKITKAEAKNKSELKKSFFISYPTILGHLPSE
jgi:hypothetical protein